MLCSVTAYSDAGVEVNPKVLTCTFTSNNWEEEDVLSAWPTQCGERTEQRTDRFGLWQED